MLFCISRKRATDVVGKDDLKLKLQAFRTSLEDTYNGIIEQQKKSQDAMHNVMWVNSSNSYDIDALTKKQLEDYDFLAKEVTKVRQQQKESQIKLDKISSDVIENKNDIDKITNEDYDIVAKAVTNILQQGETARKLDQEKNVTVAANLVSENENLTKTIDTLKSQLEDLTTNTTKSINDLTDKLDESVEISKLSELKTELQKLTKVAIEESLENLHVNVSNEINALKTKFDSISQDVVHHEVPVDSVSETNKVLEDLTQSFEREQKGVNETLNRIANMLQSSISNESTNQNILAKLDVLRLTVDRVSDENKNLVSAIQSSNITASGEDLLTNVRKSLEERVTQLEGHLSHISIAGRTMVEGDLYDNDSNSFHEKLLSDAASQENFARIYRSPELNTFDRGIYAEQDETPMQLAELEDSLSSIPLNAAMYAAYRTTYQAVERVQDLMHAGGVDERQIAGFDRQTKLLALWLECSPAMEHCVLFSNDMFAAVRSSKGKLSPYERVRSYAIFDANLLDNASTVGERFADHFMRHGMRAAPKTYALNPQTRARDALCEGLTRAVMDDETLDMDIFEKGNSVPDAPTTYLATVNYLFTLAVQRYYARETSSTPGQTDIYTALQDYLDSIGFGIACNDGVLGDPQQVLPNVWIKRCRAGVLAVIKDKFDPLVQNRHVPPSSAFRAYRADGDERRFPIRESDDAFWVEFITAATKTGSMALTVDLLTFNIESKERTRRAQLKKEAEIQASSSVSGTPSPRLIMA